MAPLDATDVRHPRHPRLGYARLSGWLLLMAWAFWLLEAQPAYARAQLASDPARIANIEAWGARLGAGSDAAPLLVLLPSACGCDSHIALSERLLAIAETAGLKARHAVLDARMRRLLPSAAGAALFNAEGRLLFAGPIESPLHCSDSRSLVELLLPYADAADPPLWAAVIDDACACDGRYTAA
jgi:hypothetical protein